MLLLLLLGGGDVGVTIPIECREKVFCPKVRAVSVHCNQLLQLDGDYRDGTIPIEYGIHMFAPQACVRRMTSIRYTVAAAVAAAAAAAAALQYRSSVEKRRFAPPPGTYRFGALQSATAAGWRCNTDRARNTHVCSKACVRRTTSIRCIAIS